MSYESERTPGTQTAYIYGGDTTEGGANQLKTYFKELTGSGSGAGTRGLFDNNNAVKLNGVSYKLKNYIRSSYVYNLYDVVAISKAAGYSNAQINDALNAVYLEAKLYQDSYLNAAAQRANNFLTDYNAIVEASHGSVAAYMSNNTVTGLSALVDEINKNNPNAGAYIETKLNKDGVTYTYTLKYTNPRDGVQHTTAVNPNEVGIQGNGDIDEAIKNDWYAQNGLNEVFKQHQVLDSTTKDSMDIAQAVQDKLQYVDTASANTGLNLTPDQAAAIKGETPSTSGLQAYNKANQNTIYDKIAGNFKTFDEEGNADSDVIARAKLTKLQQLAGMVNEENKNTTLRNLDNQTAQLLEQIRKDPELYNSIVSQLRSDAASGTIAGQRAANTSSQVDKIDSTYDEAASKLYSSLFSGEGGSIADTTRTSTLDNKTNALTSYIESQLSNASKKVADEEALTKDIQTTADAIKAALGVDELTFAGMIDAASGKVEAEARAKGEAALNAAKMAGSNAEAELDYIASLFGVSQEALADAAANNTQISETIRAIRDAIQTGTPVFDYTRVNTPELQASKKDENFEYNAVVNNPIYWAYMASADALSADKSMSDFAKDNGLDMLTEEGLAALYRQNAEEANQESNQVFNAAQRAYIAAVTAGDAKTTEQLTRLAAATEGSKGNLYAASALANQFKQQDNASVTGRQLATDYQNQQAANLNAVAQSGLNSNKALTQYLGDANNPNTYSLYGLMNRLNTTTGARRDAFGQIGSSKMSTTAALNRYKNVFDVNTHKALADLALSLEDANKEGALSNTVNTAAKKSLGVQAQSVLDKNQEIRLQNGLNRYETDPRYKGIKNQ